MSKRKITILFFLFAFLFPSMVSAEPNTSISETLIEKNYSVLEDGEKAHYYLDVSSTTQEEEDQNAFENFFDSAKSWMTGDAIKDGISAQFYEFLNLVSNLIFEWNKMMTNVMIGFLNFSFEMDIIDGWINILGVVMANLSGISNLSFTQNGLFGSFIGLIVVSTGLFAAYQMLVKRATFASLDTILKTVLTLSIALLLFTNFAPFLKGVNDLTNQLSQSLMTGSSNTITADDRTPEELREGVSNNLWDMFIVRPYLIMQYGNEDVNTVGVDRVNELLAMPKGEDRQNYIESTEIADRGNTMMTYDNVPDRFVFTFIYSPINAIVSIPIFLLGLALIVFQVWFLLMAFIAPFALVLAAFPGQFGILKKYSIELAYPLICKLIATVATLFIFTLGFMIYNISGTGNISQYLIIVFMQFVMFCLLFLLRKRISRVFSGGNSLMDLRRDINSLQGSIADLGQQAVKTGLAVATGGGTAAASYIGSQVVSSVANKGSSQDGDDEAPVEEEGSDSVDGTKPLASMYDAVQNVDNSSNEGVEESENEVKIDGTKPLGSINDVQGGSPTGTEGKGSGEKENASDHTEKIDGTKPLGSIKDVQDGSPTGIEGEDSGEKENASVDHTEKRDGTKPLANIEDVKEDQGDSQSHLRLVHDANYDSEKMMEEEQESNEKTTVSDGSKPFASIYDVSPETIPEHEEITSYEKTDGTKPLDDTANQEEYRQVGNKQESNNEEEPPEDDEGDITYGRGDSR